MSTPPIRVPITATDETGPAFAAAAAKSQAFQASVGKMSGSFTEARGAAKLFSEEIGVSMNRELLRAVASSELLQGALSAALPVGLAIGFLEVAGRLGETLKNAFDVAVGIKASDELIAASAHIEESLHKIAERTAEAAAAYERLGKSAQTVAIMDKADASAKLQSSQAQLALLKSMLTAQEQLARQTEPTLGKATSYGPTDAAKTAQELIPNLKDQIRTLENGMKLLEIGSESTGKKMDQSLTTAFDRATAAAERGHAALVKWDLMWNRIRSNNEFMPAPAQKMLDQAQIAGGPITAPDWMSQLSNVQTPLYSGSREAMNLQTIQTDQAASVQAAQDIYEQTATKAQKYSDTLAQLNELLNQGKISEQQFAVAAAQAGDGLKGANKYAEQLGRSVARNIEQALLFQESWKKALESVLQEIVKTILQMEVFGKLASAFGGSSGGFLGSLFSGLAGGAHADGGTIPAGQWGLVGERGPELAFGGSSGLNITPNGKFGGGTVNHFDMRGSIVTDDVVRRAEMAAALRATENRSVVRAVASANDLSLRR
jgi:ABC-type transporter Mla subunit MlaD